MSDFVIDHRLDGTPVFVDREEHYLMHHGIPGQKWGKRNGPPYPLDEKDYSKREKKLAKEANRLKKNYEKHEKDPMKYGSEEYIKDLKKSSIYKDITSSDRVILAKEKLDSVGKYAIDYNSLNAKEKRKYEKLSALKFLKKYPDWGSEFDTEEEAVDWIVDYSDVLQGEYSGFRSYIKEKGIDYDRYSEKLDSAENEFLAELKESANQILGDIGNLTLEEWKDSDNNTRYYKLANELVQKYSIYDMGQYWIYT